MPDSHNKKSSAVDEAAAKEAEKSISNGVADADKGSLDFGPNCHMSSHPVLSHKITKLRSSTTSTGTFRAIMREVTYHLGYEATSTSLTTKPIAVSVPVPNKESHHVTDCQGHKLKERVAMIPILRSGLGMIDGMLELLPNSSIHHIGMYRVLGQNPVQYFNRLPRKCEADIAFVLDPLIATSSTVTSVVKILEKWGVPKIHVICVIASAAGLRQLLHANPRISVTVGIVDAEVDDNGNILPGLGDVGDRLFNITQHDLEGEDDESLLHPSKRKRALSQGA